MRKLAWSIIIIIQDWAGKVIHWELCKKLKFDHPCKWYMHNPEYILENETHKTLWDFEIQTDHLISARRPDLEIVKKKLKNKRTCQIEDFAGQRRKLWNMGITMILIVIGAHGTVRKKMKKRAGRIGNKNMSGNYPNDSAAKISQNTEKSPGDLRKFAVTQTPLKDHQLMLRKTCKDQ